MTVDFGKTADDYARYRAGFPDEIYPRLSIMGIGLPGKRLLDLGCGTGTLARDFAKRGCLVTGLDLSEQMIEQAKRLDEHDRVNVNYVVTKAEQFEAEPGSFDDIIAGQCWHWFDRKLMAEKCMQLLTPGGALTICHFDYLTLPGNIVEKTEQLILEINPGWNMAGSTGFYPQWALDLHVAGFKEIESFSIDIDVPYNHESWRGRMRACNGVAASLSKPKVEQFDKRLAKMLVEKYPEDQLHVPHRLFAIVGYK